VACVGRPDTPAQHVHQQVDDQECQGRGQSGPHCETRAESDVPRAEAKSETADRGDQQDGGHEEQEKDDVNRQTGLGALRYESGLNGGQDDSDEYHARANRKAGGPCDTPFIAEAQQSSHVPTPPARCYRYDARSDET
jgi:hypothetical protein